MRIGKEDGWKKMKTRKEKTVTIGKLGKKKTYKGVNETEKLQVVLAS